MKMKRRSIARGDFLEHHWLSRGDFESPGFIEYQAAGFGSAAQHPPGEDLLLACLRGMRIQTQSTYLEYLKARCAREYMCPGCLFRLSLSGTRHCTTVE